MDESDNIDIETGSEDSKSVKDDESKRTFLEQAVPMDKLRNGMNTAGEFFNLGINKVKDATNDLQNNEKVQQLRNQIEPTLNESVKQFNENASNMFEKGKDFMNQAGEKIKPQMDKMYEEAKKVVDNVTKPRGKE